MEKPKGHFVEIKDDIYGRIKEYCQLNKIKITKFINDLIEKQFLIEIYGDAPFLQYNSQENKNAEELYEIIINGVGGKDKYDDMISELIFDDNKEEQNNETNNIKPIINTKEQSQQIIETDLESKQSKNEKTAKRRLKSK